MHRQSFILVVLLALSILGYSLAYERDLKKDRHYAFDNEIFNPSSAPLLKRYPYRRPSQSPFLTEEEGKKAVVNDPWLNSVPKYGSHLSFYEMRALQVRWMDAEKRGLDSRSLERALHTFSPTHRVIRKSISRVHPKTGARSSLEIDAKLIDGAVNLDIERSVVKVKCLTDRLIHIKFNGFQDAEKWIPGSRFVVDKIFDCTSHLREGAHPQESNIFLLVKSRKMLADNYMEYEVEPLEQNEMFISSKFKLRHQPNPDMLNQMYDSSMTDQRMYRQTAIHYDVHPKWNKGLKKSSNKRYHVLKQQRYDLLNYNYDTSTGKGKVAFDLFKYSNGGFTSRSVCVDCFAYIYFDFLFEFDSTFLRINTLRAELGGGSKFRFKTETTFGYNFDKTWQKKILQYGLPSISFSAGPIPIHIKPSLILDGKVRVKIDAKLQITHSASYEESLTVGINYYYKTGMKKVRRRGNPSLVIGKPQISDDSKAVGDVIFTLMPTLRLSFYSIVPLDLTFMPYVKLNAKVGDTICGRAGASFATYWGLDLKIQLQKLMIPNSIYGIGGKTFDLGGTLPYPKNPADATFSVVRDSPLRCSVCSGCVDLSKIFSKYFKRTVVDSFEKERSINPRNIVGQTTNMDLGKDTTVQNLEGGQCQVYKMDQILPNSFMYNGEDSREILADVELVEGTGRVYWSETEDKVRTQTADRKADVTVSNPANIAQKWSTMYVSVCATTSMKYQLITKPHAKLPFRHKTPKIHLPGGKGLKLSFFLPKDFSDFNRVEFDLMTLSGDVDARVHLYSARNGVLDVMDQRSLVLDKKGEMEEVILNADKYNHNDYDFIVVANFIGREEQGGIINQFELTVTEFVSTFVRQLVDNPTVNQVRIYRSEAEFRDIMEFDLIVKKEPQVASETICSLKQCFTVTSDEEEYHRLTLTPEEIQGGKDYFRLTISGTGLATLRVNEYRYIRSGDLERLSLAPRSHGGIHLVLFKSKPFIAYDADELIIKGKAFLRPTVVCSECNVEIVMQIVDDRNEKMNSILYTKTLTTTDGVISYSLSYAQIAQELGRTVESIKTCYTTAAIYSENIESDFEFQIYEVTELSAGELSARSVVHHDQVEEINIYKLSKDLLKTMDKGAIIQVSGESEGGSSDQSNIGSPFVMIQKGGLPSHGSMWMEESTSQHDLRQGFRVPDAEDSDVYLGVSTYSQSLAYHAQILPLPVALISISYKSGDKTGFKFNRNDIANHGLTIKMDLNDHHFWAGSITDADDLERLMSMFQGNTPEWKPLHNHIISSLRDSLSRGTIEEYLQYGKNELIINIPPYKSFKLNERLLINSPKKVSPSFLSTQDDKNAIKSDTRTVQIEPVQSLFYGFWFVLLSAIAFIGVLAVFAVCAFIVIGCALGGKRATTPKLPITSSSNSEDLQQELLNAPGFRQPELLAEVPQDNQEDTLPAAAQESQ